MAPTATPPLNFYVSSLHEPESVCSSVNCRFLSSESVNFVLKYSGSVLNFLTHCIVAKGCVTDLLFVSTEKYNFCILQYDGSNARVTTIATGSLRDKACRPADAGQLVCTDPQAKMVVLHIFQGLLKIVPVDTKRLEQVKFKDPFNVRLDELQVHDIALMQDEEQATLAVLHETIGARRHVKTYRIEGSKELEEAVFMFDVDDASHRIVAVPRPRGGLLIIADRTVQYYNHKSQAKLAVSFNAMSRIVAHTRIDDDGFRYLLGDQKGNLMVLILQAESSGAVAGLKLEILGQISVPSALEYLDDGRVFVGSRLGPNQVVRLASKRISSTGSFVQVLESQDTFSPILDIKSIDLDSTGQQTLVACSGAFADGGITIVRRGAAVEATLGFSLGSDDGSAPAVVGIWPLDLVGTGKADHIAFATPFSTSLLRLDVDGGFVEELSSQQILLGSESSLYIGQRGPMVYQVTSASVNYKACNSGSNRRFWLPQNGVAILQACSLGSALLVGLSSGCLVLFEMNESELVHRKMVPLGAVPSAVALGRVGRSLVGFTGLWCPFSVLAVDLDLDEASPKPAHVMGLHMVPRSIHCSAVGQPDKDPQLFAALPDGTVTYGQLHRDNQHQLTIQGVRTAQIGKESTSLCGLPDDSGVFVMADHPCVVTSSAMGRPHFLSVPISGLHQWAPVSLGPPESAKVSYVAVSMDNEVTIGSLDLSKKSKTRLHTIKICLSETVRRIVHCPAEGTLVGIAVRPAPQSFQSLSSQDTSSVILLDGRTFEVIDRYVLPAGECVQCITALPMSIVVGTADATERDDLKTCGRILSFRIIKAHEHGRTVSRLSLINALPVEGAVYSLAWTKDRLVASVNGQTCLYRWEESGSELGWKQLAQHFGQIVGVHIDSLDDHLAIADMMRSASIIRISPEGDKLSEVARDYYTGWATFNKFVDKQHVLMSDDHGNISQLVMTADPNFFTERLILEHTSAFHLGSLVNVMIEGSLSERGVSDKSLFTKSFIFGTACGTLGTIGVLGEASLYELLTVLQKNILSVTKTAGHFNHSDWRSFYNEKRAMANHANFIDGDVIQRFQSLPEDLQKSVVLGGAHHCTRLPGDKTLRDISELVDRLSTQ